MDSNHSMKWFAAVAAVLMLCVATAPALAHESDAANAGGTVNIQPGQTWSWTPTFPTGLTPTLTVSGSDTSMPADTATFSATSGNAKVQSGKIVVTLPSSYSKTSYYVKVKAVTTQPSQTVYYEITFNVATFSLSYSADSIVAKVGTAITSVTPTIGGGVAATSYSISGTLPTGLTFNTSTGVISGTPTAYKAQANYTITATLNTSPVQTVTKTISIGAYTSITASNYTVYAMTGNTAITVPGVAMPTGTSLASMTTTVKKDNTADSGFSIGTAYNGMTVEASTGKITGTPSAAATYVFTQKYTATAATGGSSATRTVTVVVEDKVAIGGGTTAYSYVGHSDTHTFTKSAGPSDAKWSITSIKKDGTAITSGTDFNSITISNGVVTSSADTSAGTYTIAVKLASAKTTTTTSGATGSKASSNSATKTLTLYIKEQASFTGATNGTLDSTFYMATNKVYDSLTIASNLGSDATFSIASYGTGITNKNIAVSTAGVVSPGSTALSTPGTYTVTVKIVDANNSTNTATATLNVVVKNALAFTNTTAAGAITA